MIWLQHPDHGRKTALMECEAIQDEANGWYRIPPPADRVPDVKEEIPMFALHEEEEPTPVKKTWSRRKK